MVGMAIAHRLAKDGMRITLLERNQCGREASWAGAGIIAPPNPHRRDALATLQLRSVAQYEEWIGEVGEASGIDPEFERCGELQLVFSKSELGILLSEERVAGERLAAGDPPTHVVHKPHEIKQIEPAVTNDILGALDSRSTAQVRNPRVLQALQLACRKAGVDVCEHAAVHDLLMEGDRVLGVMTDTEKITGGHTILCAGAWSSTIGNRLQELMPVHPVLGQMILLKANERPFQHILSHRKYYLVARRDGHILLGSTEEPEAGFRKRNTPQGIGELIAQAIKIAPCLAQVAMAASWSGLRPGTPDGLPYIGPVPGMDGLFAATGHMRAGLTLAPATAEVVAGMLQGREYDIDLSCCRPGRDVTLPGSIVRNVLDESGGNTSTCS